MQIARRYNTTVRALAAANPGLNPRNLRIGQIICIPSPNRRPGSSRDDKCFTKAQVALINRLRELWVEHVVWTRMIILSIAANSPDTELVINRLLRNPGDFAAEFRTLYGNRAASELDSLLKSHLVIAAELVKAAKAGDSRAAADAEREWYANADELAAFLAGVNPYWTESAWKTALYRHLSLTKEEAVNRLQGNYARDIMLYDEIQKQALEMADMMSSGIIQQFPNRF